MTNRLLTIAVLFFIGFGLQACNDKKGSNSSEALSISQSELSQPQSTLNQEEPQIEPLPVAPTRPATKQEAARFLMRTTFGPTQKEVEQLMKADYEQWLDAQFNLNATFQLSLFDKKMAPLGDIGGHDRKVRSDIWFDTALHSQDQLRQRMAFALSQILVVSELDKNISRHTRGFAHYNDVLLRHSFGNFRDLLSEVTLHPIMGTYLSMRQNRKENADASIQPDENFAREIMQLFTIGLYELNIDGSRKKNDQGQTIATYGQKEITEFARVFTGWNIGDANQFKQMGTTENSFIIPMKAFEEYHDNGQKKLLNGFVVPAGQTAYEDIQSALDNLFNHPNVGPFISQQLIQRFVTSNPSPGYIARVARQFNNNGKGERGDLKAVLKAILLDPEALLGHELEPEVFGKLKEPVLKVTQLLRAYNATGVVDDLRYERGLSEMGQHVFSASSVFNFYLPHYKKPGIFSDLELASPEFQIYHDTTALEMQNRFLMMIFERDIGSRKNLIKLNLTPLVALAEQPHALLDHIEQTLFNGQMTTRARNIIIEHIENVPLGDGQERAREALLLSVLSPDFSYQQ